MGRWSSAALRGAAHAAMRVDDQSLFLRLFMLPTALTRQVAALAYPDRELSSLRVHLHRLAARGLLDRLRLVPNARRPGAVKGGALWYLTPAGRQVAASIWGLEIDQPIPLAPPTTPRAAAMALAAAAVTEWVVLCRQAGVDVRLALPGADLGWPGWPTAPGKEALAPPPIVLARVASMKHTIAVDFMRAGGNLAAARLALYEQVLSTPSSGVSAILVVGWGSARRQLADRVLVADPAAGAQWLSHQ